MRFRNQIVVAAAVIAVSLPAAARFVPGSHPWLDAVGLLGPLRAAGLAAEPSQSAGGQGGGGMAGGPATVIAAEPVRQRLSDVVTAVGSARGAQSVALTSGVSGRLVALKVTAGAQVSAGEVIAELDDEAARLAVERAQLVLADAQATMQRLERLAASGTTTDLQRQDAELALRTAELALRAAERDLQDHRITAPISGFVGLIEVQPGDQVSPSVTITRIEDRSSLIVDFRVPERLAAMIATGDPVQASPLSAPETVLEGRISAIDNRVDETSRTLRVQASIANTDDALRAGMAFRIALAFTGAEHPAVDPLAIQWGGEGAFVWIVRGGKAQRLPIRILQRNADTVLVEAALQPGDLVVTEGVQVLRPGAEVAVAGAPAAPKS